MEPATGNVRALVGGYDFDRSHFNRAVQARRQPGSSFKPLVYAAALDRNIKPASVIVDEPVSYRDNGRIWAPQNFDKKFHGPTSLREALTKSRNVVTVRLAERVGLSYLTGYLPRFGLQGPIPRNLSIALGTLEVTPMELAVAYSTFANNGLRATPVMITEISDAQGQVLERNEPQLTQVLPPTTAYQMTSMLQDVVRRGTGTAAQGLSQPTAGKTGTTNDLEDAWFVGYTPQLLSVVWIGFDNKRPLGPKSTGGRVSAPSSRRRSASRSVSATGLSMKSAFGLCSTAARPASTRVDVWVARLTMSGLQASIISWMSVNARSVPQRCRNRSARSGSASQPAMSCVRGACA
jgi:penicillin-binding protein 1A